MFEVSWWVHALSWGSISALITGATLITVFFVAPYAFFSDYPADIRAAARPPSEQERRKGLIGGLIFMLVLLGGVATVVFSWAVTHPGASFLELALMAFAAIFLFVIVDLVIVDWLFICTIRPRAIVLDDSADCAGWRDFTFHVREQFRPKGLMVLLVVSVVFGGLAWLMT